MSEKDKELEQLDIENEAPAADEKPIEEPAAEAEQALEEIVKEDSEPADTEEADGEKNEEESEEPEEEVKVYEPHEKKTRTMLPALSPASRMRMLKSLQPRDRRLPLRCSTARA